jgi:hypothetical protein
MFAHVSESTASDPRDNFFAITGFVQESLRSMITVDYMASVDKVFRQAVTVCMTEHRGLRMIRYTFLPPNANLATASTFEMEHFKQFLAHSVHEDVLSDDYPDPLSFNMSDRQVPRGQLLPCLIVRSYRPVWCNKLTRHKGTEYPPHLPVYL